MFIQPVLRVVAKHYVQKYLPSAWDCEFNCGQIVIKKNAIIFQNAHISLSTNISDMSTKISVDAIEIKFRPFMRIYCIRPLVVCTKSEPKNNLDKLQSYKNHFTSLPCRLEIESGEAHMIEDGKLTKFSFSLATPCKEASGIISIASLGEDPCIIANYLYKQNKLIGNISFKEVQLENFYSLCNIFFPLEAKWISGSTTGYLSFGEELNGKIICSNFTYLRKNSPLQISCEKCDIIVEEKNSLPMVSCSVKEGGIFLSREEEGPCISIQNIYGEFGINHLTEISANLQAGDHALPFILRGEGKKGEMLFGNNSSQKISYYVSKERDGILLSLDLDRILGVPLFTIQYVLNKICPEFQPFSLESGIIDGKVSVLWNRWKLTKIVSNQFSLTDVIITDKSRMIQYVIPKSIIEGKIDFSIPDLFDRFCGTCTLSQGKILASNKDLMRDVTLNLKVKYGYLESSEIAFGIDSGIVQGVLSGPITSPDFSFIIQSTTQAIHKLYGIPYKKNQPIALHGKYIHGETLSGDLVAISLQEKLHIDIDLTKECNLWKIINRKNSTWCQKITFYGKDLSSIWYENFIHYLFPETSVSGLIDIEGNFTLDKLKIVFSSRDLNYKSPHVSFSHAKFTNGSLSWQKDRPITLHIPTIEMEANVHRIDLKLTRAIGELVIENNNIFFKKVEGEMENLFFSGEISLIEQIDNSIKLFIKTISFRGDLEKLLLLAKQAPSFPHLNIPLHGTMISSYGGFYLESHFTRKNIETKWKIEADIENASYAIGSNGMLDQLQFHITIDSEKGIIGMNNVQSIYTLDQSIQDVWYRLYIPKIECSFLQNVQCKFDARLTTDTHDLIRLVGQLSQIETSYILELDQRYSHILNSNLEQTKITWNNTQILHAKVKCQVSLEEIYHQFLSIKQTFFFSTPYMELLHNSIKNMNGLLKCEMSYDGKMDRFNLQIDGKKTFWKGEKLPVFLITERINREWNILSCIIGAYQLEGKLLQDKDSLEFSYLKGKHYMSQFLCTNGMFDYNRKKLVFQISDLNVALNEWKFLFPIEWTEWLSGNINSSGQVKIDFSKDKKAWIIETKLSCKWDQACFTKLALDTTSDFCAFFSVEEGLQIEKGALTLLHKGQACGSIVFDTIKYHKSRWEGKNLIITLPSEAVIAIASNNIIEDFRCHTDKLIWKDYSFSWENQMRICTSFVYEYGQFTINGTLDPGYYWLGKKSFLFDMLSFSIKEDCCYITVETPLQERKITIFASIPLQKNKEIHCTISDSNSSEQSILITTLYSEDGFIIKKINGSLCGLEIDFLPTLDKIPGINLLKGSIKINVALLGEAFPKYLAILGKQISIHSKYELYGTFSLDRKNWQNSSFIGCVRGKNIDILGYQLQSIFGEVNIENHNITIKNFSIYDLAMQLRIPNGCIKKIKEQGWKFSLPKIIVRDMRPSLLKKVGISRSIARPFLITELRCNEINGWMDDPLSFTGSGFLHFTNTYKTEYNFFSIPMEIISRLGLDISMLVPVQGTLEYAIKQGKIQLLQLKKCYSKGKRSQFHLVSNDPSYIDWNGKLHVNLRVKQYALLKIAELFILSIYGNLESPHISLR